MPPFLMRICWEGCNVTYTLPPQQLFSYLRQRFFVFSNLSWISYTARSQSFLSFILLHFITFRSLYPYVTTAFFASGQREGPPKSNCYE